MLPTYMITRARHPPRGSTIGSAGEWNSRQVDAGVDHTHAVCRHTFLVDQDSFHRLTEGDHRGGMPKDAPFQGAVSAENKPPAQAVALDFVAKKGMDLVDHRPVDNGGRRIGPCRSSVVLGVNQVERLLACDPLQGQARWPSLTRVSVEGCPFEFAARSRFPPKAAALGSRPSRRALRAARSARMILIGSIAVPSNSPGIGNEVTIKIRMGIGSIPAWRKRVRGSAYQILDSNRLAAMALTPRERASHATV